MDLFFSYFYISVVLHCITVHKMKIHLYYFTCEGKTVIVLKDVHCKAGQVVFNKIRIISFRFGTVGRVR